MALFNDVFNQLKVLKFKKIKTKQNNNKNNKNKNKKHKTKKPIKFYKKGLLLSNFMTWKHLSSN